MGEGNRRASLEFYADQGLYGHSQESYPYKERLMNILNDVSSASSLE